jgi:hypothetical protein
MEFVLSGSEANLLRQRLKITSGMWRRAAWSRVNFSHFLAASIVLFNDGFTSQEDIFIYLMLLLIQSM